MMGRAMTRGKQTRYCKVCSNEDSKRNQKRYRAESRAARMLNNGHGVADQSVCVYGPR